MKKTSVIFLVLLLAMVIVLPSCSGKKSGADGAAEGDAKEGVVNNYPEKSIDKIKEALVSEDTVTIETIERTVNTINALSELEISIGDMAADTMPEDVKAQFDKIMADNNYTDYVEYMNDIKKVVSGYEVLLMLDTLESQKGIGGAMMDASAPLVYEMTKSILTQNPTSEGDLKVIYENKDKVESLKQLFK